ncbi:MAG: helix-turn-helix domain-containing protein [Patescibacteria group bacterium]|nr:helix-turn-helix domain-containing protein [Patescibacteria group bacterium]
MIRAGQKLEEARLQKNLSLADVSQSTKIKVGFLDAIEKGEYERLPSVAYAQGFVRNYARFLNMPEKETLALFRREFDEEKTLRVLPQGFAKTKEFSLSRFKSKQTLFLVSLVFLILVGYILFQYRGALISPSLYIISPKENAVISSSVVTVIGKTDPNSTVYINKDLISVDQGGNFEKTINVFPGKTTIIVKAANKFGKETVLQRDIEIKPGY